VQAFTPFARKFGKQTATGGYALPAKLASIMNSIPLIGKLTGTVIVSPIIEVSLALMTTLRVLRRLTRGFLLTT